LYFSLYGCSTCLTEMAQTCFERQQVEPGTCHACGFLLMCVIKSANQILNIFANKQLCTGVHVFKPPVPCKSSCYFPADMSPVIYCAASEVKEYHRSSDRSQANNTRHHEPSNHNQSAQSMQGLNSNVGKHDRQAIVAWQTMVKQRKC